MKPENRFRQLVHKHLPPEIYHEKMSNPFRSGTPDDYYEGPGGMCWIEYKWRPYVSVRGFLTPALSPQQSRWLFRADRNHIRCFVIVGSSAGGIVLSSNYWIDGVPAAEIDWVKPAAIAGFIHNLLRG